jgi:L-alanine-DL-glutamate epimerase-like enolase superfamily enzyme
MKPSDVGIENVRFGFEDYTYRTAMKFADAVVDRVTLLKVEVEVRNRAGRVSAGSGSMPLGNLWSFPSKRLSYSRTLDVMKRMAREIAAILNSFAGKSHPIEICWQLEPAFDAAAERLTRSMNLPEPVPRLSTAVVASAFDAAIHDAFGKANGINCYRGYSPEYMDHDLGRYLGPDFAGEWLPRYISESPKNRLPVYHLVGGLDPIWPGDVGNPIGDGLPEALTEWIAADGLTHFKIKLNGRDLAWDLERVLTVERAVCSVPQPSDAGYRCYSLDFNERCFEVSYVIEFLRRLQDLSPELFDRIQYIEQPTSRDLTAHPAHDMHRAAELKPVVIDEALVDFASLLQAREIGYSGVALKVCKGQSNSLLIAAAAQKFGMFVCVQDLTCPGASFLHSAGLAAHVPAVTAIEANARQYVPDANRAWARQFPELMKVQNGQIRTTRLHGPGLGTDCEVHACTV